MAPSIAEDRPLLRATSTVSSYGATEGDVESSWTPEGPPKPKAGEEVKQNKQFREIWALCLGLWTSWVLFLAFNDPT